MNEDSVVLCRQVGLAVFNEIRRYLQHIRPQAMPASRDARVGVGEACSNTSKMMFD